MSEREKIEVIEDLLEVEPESLKIDSVLSELDEWDSLAIISLLAYFDTEYGIKLSSHDIKRFVYVKDIVDMM